MQLPCWRIERTFVPKRGHFEKLIDEKMVGLGPPVEGLGCRAPRTCTDAPGPGLRVLGPESRRRVRRGDGGSAGPEQAAHALTCSSLPAELGRPGEIGWFLV